MYIFCVDLIYCTCYIVSLLLPLNTCTCTSIHFTFFYNYNREVQHYWVEHLECSGDLDGAIDECRSCGDYRSV